MRSVTAIEVAPEMLEATHELKVILIAKIGGDIYSLFEKVAARRYFYRLPVSALSCRDGILTVITPAITIAPPKNLGQSDLFAQNQISFGGAENRQQIVDNAGFNVADFVEGGVPRQIRYDRIENAEISHHGQIFEIKSLQPGGRYREQHPHGQDQYADGGSRKHGRLIDLRRSFDCSSEYTAKAKVLARTYKSPLTSLILERAVKSPRQNDDHDADDGNC